MTENAGQGDTPTSATPASGGPDVAQLQQQLSELQTANDRLRGTQSANDRTISKLTADNTALTNKITDSEAALAAAQRELDGLKASSAELTQRLGELAPLKDQVTQLTDANARLKIAATMAASNPAIGVLIEAGALPQTATVEDFKAALEGIAGKVGSLVNGQVRDTLTGARPPAPSPNEPTVEGLENEGWKLAREPGKMEEAQKLFDQARALREKQH